MTSRTIDSFINEIRKCWDIRPSEIFLPANFQIFTEQELASGLKKYGLKNKNELQKYNKLAEFVTAIDNVKTKTPQLDFLISDNDTSIDDYLLRVDSLNKSREWSIAYFGLHGSNAAIWDKSKWFVDTVTRSLGYRPGGRVDVDCFIGRYSSTPSGIHVDGAHNFGFTFKDGKTMFTWPPERQELLWLKSPDYDIYKKDSLLLENSNDRVCYFPHNYLHVAETKSQVSLNVNISFWKYADDYNSIIKYIESKCFYKKISMSRLPVFGQVSLPLHEENTMNTVKLLIRNNSIEKQTALKALLSETTSGMKVPRPLRYDNFDDTTKSSCFFINEIASLQWYELSDLSEIILASNGHCVVLEYSSDIKKILERVINTKLLKQSFILKDLLEADIEKYHNIFSFLFETGTIDTI